METPVHLLRAAKSLSGSLWVREDPMRFARQDSNCLSRIDLRALSSNLRRCLSHDARYQANQRPGLLMLAKRFHGAGSTAHERGCRTQYGRTSPRNQAGRPGNHSADQRLCFRFSFRFGGCVP